MSEQRANNWCDAPSTASWYGMVIAVPTEGDVDYFDGYSASSVAPDITELVPDGWRVLEMKLAGVPQGVAAGIAVEAAFSEDNGAWLVSWRVDPDGPWTHLSQIPESELGEAWAEAYEEAILAFAGP
jgi:hypothetical protein